MLLVWAVLAPQIATPVAAQESKVAGSIEGTVADASGALIPGVTVVIKNSFHKPDANLDRRRSGIFPLR